MQQNICKQHIGEETLRRNKGPRMHSSCFLQHNTCTHTNTHTCTHGHEILRVSQTAQSSTVCVCVGRMNNNISQLHLGFTKEHATLIVTTNTHCDDQFEQAMVENKNGQVQTQNCRDRAMPNYEFQETKITMSNHIRQQQTCNTHKKAEVRKRELNERMGNKRNLKIRC